MKAWKWDNKLSNCFLSQLIKPHSVPPALCDHLYCVVLINTVKLTLQVLLFSYFLVSIARQWNRLSKLIIPRLQLWSNHYFMVARSSYSCMTKKKLSFYFIASHPARLSVPFCKSSVFPEHIKTATHPLRKSLRLGTKMEKNEFLNADGLMETYSELTALLIVEQLVISGSVPCSFIIYCVFMYAVD